MCMTLAPHASAGVCMMMHAMDHSGHDAHSMPASVPQGESLLETLRVKRRYALGEINREQFEEMKRVLNLGAAQVTAEHAHH